MMDGAQDFHSKCLLVFAVLSVTILWIRSPSGLKNANTEGKPLVCTALIKLIPFRIIFLTIRYVSYED